jgi:hypothetical protein
MAVALGGPSITVPVIEIELSSTTLSPLTGFPEAQVWVIRHFSRYMLASG